MGLGALVQFSDARGSEDRAALIGGCRAVVVPSLYDTLGEVVLDALAAGRPVLCSHLRSLTALTGDAALLFDPHRPEDLASAFEHVERQPSLLDDLVARGRTRLTLLDDPASVAQAYLSVLRQA
jgi:glycosyltransferase involved in cell wall biosynthesis